MQRFKRLLKEIRDFVKKFNHATSCLVIYENEMKHCHIEIYFPMTKASTRKKIRSYFTRTSELLKPGLFKQKSGENLIDEYGLSFITTDPGPYQRKFFKVFFTLKISEGPKRVLNEILQTSKPIKIIKENYSFQDLNLD